MDGDEQEYLSRHRAHEVDDLLRRWRRVGKAGRMTVEVLSEEGGYPVLVLEGRTEPGEEGGVYLSAGIHGDEPAGALGLLQWAEENVDCLRREALLIAPCLNPWGLAHNLRTDEAGRDLNRRMDDPGAGPVGALLVRLEGRTFRCAAMLHEDYDARGVYLYELGRRGEGVGEHLLGAVDGIIPRHRGKVDGRATRRGLVRHSVELAEIVEEIDGMPEAIYVALHHARRTFTFETPSEFSLYLRVRAQVAFVEALMEG